MWNDNYEILYVGRSPYLAFFWKLCLLVTCVPKLLFILSYILVNYVFRFLFYKY